MTNVHKAKRTTRTVTRATYAPGRTRAPAPLDPPPAPPDPPPAEPAEPAEPADETPHGILWTDDGGRDRVTTGMVSLTHWLVWEWSKAVDDRLDGIATDMFDLAERVHYLNLLVITTFLVIVVALSAVLAVVLL